MPRFERYQRQVLLDQIGLKGQKKLENARVLVVGAGGLSSSVLPILVGSGIGFIRLYDADCVEISNLHRQILYRMSDIGKFKVDAAKIHLTALNPHCEIETYNTHLTGSNLIQAMDKIDIVVDAADRFSTTYLLSDACFSQKTPLISASVLAEQGYVGGFCGKNSPSYRAVFSQLPQTAASCQTIGVFASSVATIASLQAHMVLNVLLNLQPSALGQILSIHLNTWHIQNLRFDHAPEPDFTVQWLEQNQLRPDDIIFEFRQLNEIDYPIHRAKPMSFNRLNKIKLMKNQRIVCICQSGIRAAKAANQLQKQGYTNVYILAIA